MRRTAVRAQQALEAVGTCAGWGRAVLQADKGMQGRLQKGACGSFIGARLGQPLTRCLVFCRLFLRILRISSSLSLDSAGRMRSAVRDLGWMFLTQQGTG